MASRLRSLGSPLGVVASAATLALANPASATDDQHSQADQSNYEGSGLTPCLHCDDPSTVAVPRVERDASQNCTTGERFEGQWKPFVKICGARGDVSLAVPFPSIIKGRPGPNSDTATITLRAEGFEGDEDYCVKRPHNIEIAGTIPVAYGFTWTLPSDWNVVTLDCSMELDQQWRGREEVRLIGSLAPGAMTRVGNVSVRVHDLNPGCPINETETQMYDPLENGGGDRCNVPITLYRTRECPQANPPVTTPLNPVPFEYSFLAIDPMTLAEVTFRLTGSVRILKASYRWVPLGGQGWTSGCGRGESVTLSGGVDAELNGGLEGGGDFGATLLGALGFELVPRYEISKQIDLEPVPGVQAGVDGYLELAKVQIRADLTVVNELGHQEPLVNFLVHLLPNSTQNADGALIVSAVIPTMEFESCLKYRSGGCSVDPCGAAPPPAMPACDLGQFLP